jgi:MFS family permease
MNGEFDLAQLVGAASAPVALIIATSIFLGNLGGKYAALFSVTHAHLSEYRDLNCPEPRRQLLTTQLRNRGRRLRTLIRATFWLGVAILLFIATVILTAVSVVYPMNAVKLLTAMSLLGGLMILAVSVGMELGENHQAGAALLGDFSEFPELHSFDQPRTDADEVRDTPRRAERTRRDNIA